VKIDRSFIRDLPGDGDDAAITRAIIAMAHSLRLKVVAEGVRTRRSWVSARARMREMQGYLFSRPLAGGRMLRLLQEDCRSGGRRSRPRRRCAGEGPNQRRNAMRRKIAVLAGARRARLGCWRPNAQSTLDAVKAKGFVQCGVIPASAGSRSPIPKASEGPRRGRLRAVAAAVFGDASKVRIRRSRHRNLYRPPVGRVDVLARNTTGRSRAIPASG